MDLERLNEFLQKVNERVQPAEHLDLADLARLVKHARAVGVDEILVPALKAGYEVTVGASEDWIEDTCETAGINVYAVEGLPDKFIGYVRGPEFDAEPEPCYEPAEEEPTTIDEIYLSLEELK